MSSLPARPGHWLLRCPLCKSGFIAAVGTLVCRNRHSFDLARDGYVNLLRPGIHRPAAGGDSGTQLYYRATFHDAGHLDAVASAIVDHVLETDAERTFAPWRVLDAGSGTGHHLARVTDALTSPVIGLGLDISKDAALRAARRWPALAFAVTDLWGEWPVQDAVADLVLSIFAPKNFPEAVRVLRPGGWLTVAYPGRDHLVELRRRFGLLGQHGDNTRRYADLMGRFVGPSITTARLYDHVLLDRTMLRSAVLMGPNAHHIDPAVLDSETGPLVVTFDINLLFARKS